MKPNDEQISALVGEYDRFGLKPEEGVEAAKLFPSLICHTYDLLSSEALLSDRKGYRLTYRKGRGGSDIKWMEVSK